MTAFGFKVREGVERSRTAHAKLKQLRTTGPGKPRQEPNHFSRSRADGFMVSVREAAGHVFGRELTRTSKNVNTGGHDGC